MFKFLEFILIQQRICKSIDEEIKDYKGITYEMILHFICALPNPMKSKILSNFTTINSNNGNIAFYFLQFITLYLQIYKPILSQKFIDKQPFLIQ